MALNRDRLLFRAADAGINRACEGLRVVEDITRFVFEDKHSSAVLKKTRHKITSLARKVFPDYTKLLASRESPCDVGRKINTKTEFQRKNIVSVFTPNFKRTQESLRVLEELSKIYNKKAAAGFKELRYNIYETEKKITLKYARRKT